MSTDASLYVWPRSSCPSYVSTPHARSRDPSHRPPHARLTHNQLVCSTVLLCLFQDALPDARATSRAGWCTGHAYTRRPRVGRAAGRPSEKAAAARASDDDDQPFSSTPSPSQLTTRFRSSRLTRTLPIRQPSRELRGKRHDGRRRVDVRTCRHAGAPYVRPPASPRPRPVAHAARSCPDSLRATLCASPCAPA